MQNARGPARLLLGRRDVGGRPKISRADTGYPKATVVGASPGAETRQVADRVNHVNRISLSAQGKVRLAQTQAGCTPPARA